MSSETQLLAVADVNLCVVLADPELNRVAGHRSPIGRSLVDLFPRPEVARDLRLLRAGVAREVRLATLETEQCVVASLSLNGVPGDAPFVLVTLRPAINAVDTEDNILIGRSVQLEAFDEFLAGPDGSMFVVEGPLGIGKTALLAAYERRCRRVDARIFRLDGRAMTFEGDVLSTLAEQHLGRPSVLRLASDIASRPWLLLIDHFDAGGVSSLAERAAFFRSLPDSCRIVVAVRSRAIPFAFVFPRHGLHLYLCRLGALSPREASAFASFCGLEETDRRVHRAGGHPLSIRGLSPSFTETEPLEDLAYQTDLPVPAPALKIAALPRRITEDVLAILLEDPELASRTYDALGCVCMNDPDNLGLRMPEVLRGSLAARLERRDPSRYAALRLEIIRYLLRSLERTDARRTALLIEDLFDAFDGHAGLNRIFGNPDAAVVVREISRDEDVRAFLRTVADRADHAIAARVRSGTPTYVAEIDGQIVGLMQFVVLTSSDAAVGEDRRRIALRGLLSRFNGSGDVRLGVLLAFVLSADEEQEWGEVAQALCREHFRLLLSHRDLHGSVVAGDDGWRIVDAAVDETAEVDGVRMRVRDFQKLPLIARLLDAVSRDDSFLRAHDEAPSAALTTEAVRLALSHLAAGKADPALIAAIDAVEEPRQREVLRAIYVDRRGKHELIAAEMRLAYSTFRRHHARGLDRVRELLIQQASSEETGEAIRETRDVPRD